MAEAMMICASLFTRGLFFAHGFLCIFLGAMYLNSELVWIISLSMFGLFLEMIYTVWWRKCQEYRYFWPSGFFYIMTILPNIWMFDIESMKISKIKILDSNPKFMGMTSLNVGRLIFELGLIFGIIIGRWLMPRGKLTRDQLSALLIGYVGTAADIVELKVETNAQSTSIQFAVLGAYTWAIFQFTLVTTATIKDVSVKESEEKEKIRGKLSLNLGQYNKVFPDEKPTSKKVLPKIRQKSSTMSFGSHSNNNNNDNNLGFINELTPKEQYIQSIKRQRSKTLESMHGGPGISRKYSDLNKSTSNAGRVPLHKSTTSFDAEADRKQTKRRKLHGELFQILVTLFMQDGPFLILRLVMLVQFSVSTEMHILFLAKNGMVCSLLVYRLCILTCRAEEAEETLMKEQAASKLHNVQLAVMAGSIMRSNIKPGRRTKKSSADS